MNESTIEFPITGSEIMLAASNGACSEALDWARRFRRSWLNFAFDHNLVPVAVLERLAGDGEVGVRELVASNASCPVAVLERLAGDGEVGVRERVASNASCPVAVLERLAGDGAGWVRALVASNASCPVAVKEAIAASLEPAPAPVDDPAPTS